MIKVKRSLFYIAKRLDRLHKCLGLPADPIQADNEIDFINRYYYNPINKSKLHTIIEQGKYIIIK